MKKKSYIAVAILALGLTACHNEPSFKVEGVITGAADKTLFIEHSGIDRIESIDSVKLNENGSFTLTAPSAQTPEFYRLRVDNKVINFAIDSTETVNIKADYSRFDTSYEIKGSTNNTKIKELVTLHAKLQSDVYQLGKSGMPVGLAQDSLFRLVKQYKETVSRNYIFQEPQKPYAYFALFQQLNGVMIFDPLNNKDDIRCFAAVATSMNNIYPHAERSRNLYNLVIKGMKNTREKTIKTLEVPREKVSEASIIDIVLKDVNGKTHHVTDLKGKVVFIDFTVYAAQESGARNLALRELYKKYADKGLEIFQVSLDPNEHFWKTAADNLPWICVRDPQAQYSSYANLYGVTQIPTSFLADRNNVITLRIDEKTDIEAAIKKLL